MSRAWCATSWTWPIRSFSSAPSTRVSLVWTTTPSGTTGWRVEDGRCATSPTGTCPPRPTGSYGRSVRPSCTPAVAWSGGDGVEGDVDHLGEGLLPLVGGGVLAGLDVVADRQQG